MKNKYTLTEQEYEMAKEFAKTLPKNPCKSCWLRNNGCCGCPQHGEYRKVMNLIEDEGLCEIVMLLKRRDELLENVKKIEQEIKECEDHFKKFTIEK